MGSPKRIRKGLTTAGRKNRTKNLKRIANNIAVLRRLKIEEKAGSPLWRRRMKMILEKKGRQRIKQAKSRP